MDGILEHATNIIQAAKQPKNKTREKKQQKCWCHYLFTRGLWGLGRGGEGSLVMANARSAWSFSLDSFSCPGTKRFVTVGTRLYAAHLSRHGDANTNHLSFSLFFSLEQSQVQSLCRLVFLHGCCKFSKTSYSAMPQAFSQITSNISPLKKWYSAKQFVQSSHIRSYRASPIRLLFFFPVFLARSTVVLNWFRTSILTILLDATGYNL